MNISIDGLLLSFRANELSELAGLGPQHVTRALGQAACKADREF
jgi:hypothetical protein